MHFIPILIEYSTCGLVKDEPSTNTSMSCPGRSGFLRAAYIVCVLCGLDTAASASDAGFCPVSVRYQVSLGQQSANPNTSAAEVPPFYGTVSVYSNKAKFLLAHTHAGLV